MRLVESRLTLWTCYIVLGLFAFLALFPIALLVLNSLKPAAQIVQNPLAFPDQIRWQNFSNAWTHAKFSKTFFMSTVPTFNCCAEAVEAAPNPRAAAIRGITRMCFICKRET